MVRAMSAWRITLLKRELGLHESAEFKFNKSSQELRLRFFEATAPYTFFYFGIVINKEKLVGPGFKFRESFYKYACRLVFENAKAHLKDAIVVIDGNGSRQFKRELTTYLRKKAGSGTIKKVKLNASHSDPLLQLADMVAGAVNRSFTARKDKDVCRKLLGAKEMYVQVWPR